MAASHASYEDYQTLLYPIALKMLGNPQDAEDQVQNTLLKWLSMNRDSIENPKGYLVRTLINKCLNFIRDHQKESDHEITPELLIDLPPSRIEHEHLLSASFRMLFEKLNPVERAVFLLKEVFHYSHKEIADLLEINEVHCRQILARARRRLKDEKVRFEVEEQEHDQLFQKFMEVCQGDSLTELLQLLQLDIASYRHEPVNQLPEFPGTNEIMGQIQTYLGDMAHLLRYRLEKEQESYKIYLYLLQNPMGYIQLILREDNSYFAAFHPYLQLKEMIHMPETLMNPV